MTSLKAKRVQLYVASFFLDAVGHAYPLIVSAYAKYTLKASPLELGLLGTMATLTYAIGCLATGGLSDRRGSMLLMRASLLALSLLVFPVAFFSGSIAPLYLTNAGFGLALAFFWPPVQRQLALLSPGRTLWRSLGAFNLSWAAGGSIGTFGGPKIFEIWGLPAAMAASVAVVLLALAACAGRGFERGGGAPSEPLEDVEPWRARLFLHLAWISNFCASLALGGLHNVFVHVTASFGWSVAWAAAILCAKEMGRFAAFWLCRRSSAWHYSLAWLTALQLSGGIVLIFCGFVLDPFLLFVLFFFPGIYAGLSYYSSIYYGLNLRSEEGKKSGIHETILAVGLVLGPLMCGVAGKCFPAWPGAVLFFPGLVIVLGAGFQLAMARRRMRGAGAPASSAAARPGAGAEEAR